MTDFISTTIPYVNGDPHIGHAQEFVLADALARHQALDRDVYFHSGTDENSLKNVLAAEAEDQDTGAFVAARSDAFEALMGTLGLELTDFIRTSADVRHRPVVERIWRACVANGDIYQQAYEGLYCVGCEQFFTADELEDGVCPEHGTAPELVAEQNYFFRLTRYRDQLIDRIQSGQLRIEPEGKRSEVLAGLRDLNQDLSVSRSAQRARGWGIPVPDDPDQVIYVWIDALANYVSGPGEDRWSAFERVTHVVGKGVLRFHAIYWPAVLLSAGLRLPDRIYVHNYVTVEGKKIGKSLGNAIHPAEPVDALGLDPFRYYLLRHIGSFRDGDFSWARYAQVYEQDLANQLGNLVARVTKLAHREASLGAPTERLVQGLDQRVAAHVDRFALHKAVEIIWREIEAVNAYLSQAAPWKLQGEARRAVLAAAVDAIATIADALTPFLPTTAQRVHDALSGSADGHLFPRRHNRETAGIAKSGTHGQTA